MKYNYRIFLDNEREAKDVTWMRLPIDYYIVVRSYLSFVSLIEIDGLPTFVSFDHDLGDVDCVTMCKTEKTGYDCAKWLCEYCSVNGLYLPNYAVHSMDQVGKENITSILESYSRSLTL